MPEPLPLEQFRITETALRFEGRDHGSTISFFVTNHPPEASVPLHRHPYEETFIVQEGTAAFSIGGETVEVTAGEAIVVPPETAHGFLNTGEGPLRLVSIHPADHVQQEWLED